MRHFYSTKHIIKYRGFDVLVLPNVFVPRQISRMKGISPKNKRMYENRDVLDMGSGTGVQSIIAYHSGARSIKAVDIYATACENARQNFEGHGMRNSEVILSDLFENVVGEFDSMIAYLPSMDRPVEKIREKAVYDPGFKTFDRFLSTAREHLRTDGVIYTCWVNVNDSIKKFYAMLDAHRYQVVDSRILMHGKEEWHMFDLKKIN